MGIISRFPNSQAQTSQNAKAPKRKHDQEKDFQPHDLGLTQ